MLTNDRNTFTGSRAVVRLEVVRLLPMFFFLLLLFFFFVFPFLSPPSSPQQWSWLHAYCCPRLEVKRYDAPL